VMARLEEALAGGVGGTTDVRFFFERTGRSGWTTNRYAPFRNANGDIAGVIGTITDITDRILAQEQMLRFNENLEAQVRLRTQELAQRDAAMEAASDAMAIIDLEGVLRWANPAFGSLTGYRPEEAKGRPIRMLNSGRQDRAFFSGLWATILAGRVWQDELVNRRKDGSEYLESQTITPVPGADGTITHFVAIKRDVTGQRAAENRLRKLSQVVEESPGAVVITDTRGVIEYVNPSFTELTGYAAEEVLGGNPRILKSDLTPPQVFEDLWATILAGRIWRGELANAAKDGRLFWEKITISPLFGRDGTLTHFVAHTEDITAQRLLEENRQRLAAALEQAEDAAAILNRSGQIIFANSAFHRVLGATDRQVLGEPIGTFLEDPEQPERLAGMLAQVLDGRAWKGRHTIRTAAGARLILDGTLSPVHELEGEASSIALVFRDMTREIQRGRELIQAQKMDSLGALAGGVAHDFNNLLSSILIAAELIEWELPEDSPIRARLDIIYQVARQARELNRQILSFSRRSEDRRVPFNLTKVVQEAGTLLKATLPRGVTLHSELAAALWITGDPAQANQVVMNLAINGAQAIGAGEGRLTLTLAEREVQDADGLPLPAGRYAELCVQDDGTGMDAATLERIFEPFFTTKDAEGTGLGLSVVHGIVHGHGGHLRVESAPGQGTAFWIYLPMGPTRGPADAAPEAREYRGGERILLVDDEDIVAALSRQGLEALGYQVVAKTSPADALALFRARPGAFDLLITDLSLTEFSGDELTRRIRELRPGLPAILLSGSPAQATPGSVPVAFDAVLAKPLTPRELGAAIRRVMDASARAPEECERRTVLLAEDNPTSRVLLRSWLTKAGYLVQEARDGQEAWELFSGTRPDLLLTDIVMPRLDGLGLVARVRAAAPRFPVIILSSLEETEAAGHATRLQVDAFLQKPFDSRALLAALRRLLAGG